VRQPAEDLAVQFERAVADFERFVRACSPADWDAPVPIEERPVRVMAMHCVAGMRLAHEWLEPMRGGAAVPGDAGDLDAFNAREMEVHAGATREEVLEILRRDAPATAALLRSLSAQELVIKAPFGPGGGIEVGLGQVAATPARHVEIHLSHIREALAGR
jgi:hypothetical protein